MKVVHWVLGLGMACGLSGVGAQPVWKCEVAGQVRYSDRIDATYPYIKYTAPYREPLYALVKLEPGGAIHLDGVESEWVGPSPEDLGFLKAHGASLPLAGASVRPGITTRQLEPPTDQWQ